MARIKERKEASSTAKLRLLMWKNFMIQLRHPKQTIAELLVPVLAMALILVLRSQIDPTIEEQKNFNSFSAHTLNYSTIILANMNFTRMSIAYSPESPVLEDVVRSSVVKMLRSNILELIPTITEMFPDLVDLVPPGILNSTVVWDLLGSLIRVDGYNASAELRSIYHNEEVTREVLAAVEFEDELLGATTLPQNIHYALRFPEKPRLNSFYSQGGRSWRTNYVFPAFPIPGPRSSSSDVGGTDPGYVHEMFLALQQCISTELISRLTGVDMSNMNFRVQRYPHPAYTSDLAILALQLLFPMFIILSFSYSAINIVRAITVEKELQLKESMKIMGLPTWLHWTAWFCKQFIFLFLASVLVILLLKINFFTTEEGVTDYAVFTNTPWTILFFFLILYLTGVIFLSFMISSFFAKASTAALFMGVMWFVLYMPAVLLSMDESVSIFSQVLGCISINTAMSYGFQLILAEESTGGLQWGQFFSSPSDDGSRLLFGHVVVIIIADCVLYMLIALYCEQVFPGPFGTAQPWNFLFKKEFWVGSNAVSDDLTIPAGELNKDIVKEHDPKDLTVGVKISHLTKDYGPNRAVNNLSLNIYNDQITVLLGHNGAGKSTTISMLTGNTSPSSGSIWLAGFDVRRQLRKARAQIGLCPQHNVLFTELTVREHLQFFARLKGLEGKELSEEIDSLIEKLELQEKRDYQAGGLSGGQKRRLSVGIALCGGAKVVLLDEPTSGMDPTSRRALWDLLQNEKKDRAMILTTHFMDEADYLGERVAIMASGRLRCVGSPYFLKRHYGIGYTLVIVKSELFRPDKCLQLLRKYIPEVREKEDRGSEVAYSVSNEHSHVFGDMLTDLEVNINEIGFINYGLTATTIEDVFMSVGSDVGPRHSKLSLSDAATSSDNLSDEIEKNYSEANSSDYLDGGELTVTGVKLIWQHTYAIWLKLWLVWSRSWGLLLLQLLVPLALINATLGIVQYLVSLTESAPPRNLTLAQSFTDTETYMTYNVSSSFASAAAAAYRTFFNDDNRRLLVIEGRPLDEYYLERGSDQMEMVNMRSQVVIGATFEEESVTAWFSNFGYHDVAISLAALHSAILKAVIPDADLSVVNHPLEANYENSDDMNLIVTVLSMQLSNGIASSLAIVSAVFVMFYVKERASRAKLLQKAAGIEPVVMWGSAALFDWLWFLIISLTFVISCAAFQVTGLSSFSELGYFFLCLMVYGAAMLPLNYLFSYLFSGPAFGFVVLVFTNAMLGMMGAQIVEALESLDTVDPIVPQTMDAILQFFPLYGALKSMKNLHEISLTEWACMEACDLIIGVLPGASECTMELMCEQNPTSCCVRENPHFDWEEPGVLRYLLCMLVSCVFCWLLLMFFEYRVHRKIFTRKSSPPPLDETSLDEDVIEESKHVDQISEAALPKHNLVARKLTKYYGKHLAVNQVSFSMGEMECFGLLGVNGAGKTSTFKMLMGDEIISSGDAFVRGHSVNKSIQKVHENIGYCPQFDAVFDELTGRETLLFFALLRGLRPQTIKAMTAELANSLGFTKHLDKRVHQYSGGNKRKLSTAIALMGFARVVFLDEPTTGVDPAAKRQVWGAVRRATAAGRSVLLTSHSMEECEALCSRITIMVNGQFQCLGTPQHLKNKFSQGFTLTIKLKMSEDRDALSALTDIKNYIENNFTTPKLMEEYQGLLTYYLPERSVPWSQMFATMERAKRDFGIEDYSISQTTLEQIFLQFTKYQQESEHL